MNDHSRTSYGEVSPRAAPELATFSFLIGNWEGKGRAKTPDGLSPEFPVRWVGRYILDGTAIGDEVHAPNPDGSPTFGITFRQYDAVRRTWIIEFLNVSGSFLRRQVNATAGAVTTSGRDVTVASESPGMNVREHYLVPEDRRFTYRLDFSTDGGRTWTERQIEMDFHRVD